MKKHFEVGQEVIWDTCTGPVVVNFRGPNGLGKAVVWTGTMQVEVKIDDLRANGPNMEKDCGCIDHDGPHWLYMDGLHRDSNIQLLEQATDNYDSLALRGFINEEIARLDNKLSAMKASGFAETDVVPSEYRRADLDAREKAAMDKLRQRTGEKTEMTPVCAVPLARDMDLNEIIKTLRKNLKDRSGRDWSVTRGRGTSYSWITITAPPRRLVDGSLSDDDRATLENLLGLHVVYVGGINIPACSDYRQEYLDRSAGRTPSVIGKP